jgi:2-haloacid dehalogenase
MEPEKDETQATDGIKILTFDVFGTVVDWHTSISAEVEALGLAVDSSKFALAWRAGYQPAMKRVRQGELDWMPLDDLHRMILDQILEEFGVDELTEDEKRHLNKAWHRLRAWPDSVDGLTRLKNEYMVCTLSNGNIGLLAEMAKAASLPWDCILSAETFRHYKPDPETYLGVARVFDVQPSEIMMVAAHHDDLSSARACGLRTAYVERPYEFGPDMKKDVPRDPETTFHARDIGELATFLGC